MTITVATRHIDHVEGPDRDSRPGTIDIGWAERALERTPASRADFAVRVLQSRRLRRHLLRVLLSLAALCACLAVVVGTNTTSATAPTTHSSTTTGTSISARARIPTPGERTGSAVGLSSLLSSCPEPARILNRTDPLLVLPPLDCVATSSNPEQP